MGQRIGTAEIGVEVLDAQAIAGLRAIEAQFDSTTRRIDRMRADAEFGADTSDLDQAVANAKRRIRQLNGLKATAKLAAEKKQFDKELSKAYAELKALDGKKATVELELRGDDKVKKALAEVEKAQEAARKTRESKLREEDRLLEQSHRRHMGNVREEMKLRQQSLAGRMFSEQELERRQAERDNGILQRLTRTYGELGRKLDELAHKRAQGNRTAAEERKLEEQQVKLLARMQRIRTEISQHTAEQRETDRANAAREREIAQIPRMQLRYAQLAKTLESLNAKKRQGTALDRQTTRLNIGNTIAEMQALKETLERVGSPVEVDVDIHPGRRFGSALRDALVIGALNGGPLQQARQVGRVIGNEVETGFKRRFTRERISDAIMAPFGAAGRALGRLGDMSVRLGPFTTSVRGALLAMTILGPVVVDVIGSMGALVGSLGSAALGFGALSATVVGGGVPALLGMGLVVKDIVQEFTAAKKATKAYDDAVAKHGSSSDQAKKKLTELNRITGGLSQTTREQIGLAQDLGDRWDKATKPGRAQVWKTIGTALQGASDLLPMFSKRTNEALAVAGRGLREWINNISSDKGRSVLSNLMGDFNASLGPALSGLGKFGAYLGKLGQSAGRHLPGFMNQFKNWAAGLNGAADNTDLLNGKVDRWMNSLRAVGRFLLSGTRWMKSFFGGGVTAGNDFLDVMTNTMNRWTAFNNTFEGQAKLGKFFGDSVDGVRALWNALAPIGSIFVSWATQISPFVSAILQGVGAVGQLVSGLLSVTALRSPLLAFATTLGALWAVNKIAGFLTAIRGFTMALFGMTAAQSTTAGAATRTTAALNAQAAAAARAAAATRAAAAASAAATAAAIGSAAAAAAATGAAAAAARRPSPGRYTVIPGPVGGNLQRGAGDIDRTSASAGRLAAAGNKAKGALAGLGSVLLGTSSAMAGGLLVFGAASVALFEYANRTRDWEKAGKAASEQMKEWSQRSASLNQGNNDVAASTLQAQQAAIGLKQANKEVSDSEKDLNKLRQAGKQGTDEYKAAQDRVTQARLSAKQAQLSEITMRRQNKAMIESESKAIEKSLNVAAKAHANAKVSSDGAGQIKTGQTGGQFKGDNYAQAYRKVEQAARAAGQSVDQYIAKNRKGDQVLDMLAPNLLEYGRLLGKTRQAQAAFNHAQDQTVLESANLQRAMMGLVAIGPKAAKVFGDLARATGGKKLTMQIATKFTNPNEAQKVAQSTRATLAKGGTQSVVMRIIADSKSAEEAMRRLKAARIDDKKLRVIMSGGKEAVRTMEDIAGRKLTDKEAKAVIKGGSAAMGVINDINGKKIADKAARVLARDMATAIINKIKGQQVGGKTVRITAQDAAAAIINAYRGVQVIGQRVVQLVTKGSFAGVKVKAAGGVTMRAAGADHGVETPATQRAQERALARSEQGTLPRTSTTQLAGGMKIAGGPRAIYGEEPAHPEFVISTNPRYRDSNRDYVRLAAEALGVKLSKRDAVAPVNSKDPEGPLMAAIGSTGYKVKKNTTKAKAIEAYKPPERKKLSAKYSRGRSVSPVLEAAMLRIDEAETTEDNKQFDLDRQISKLDEPSSFVNEKTDPKTGITAYTVDYPRISAWQKEMAKIATGYEGQMTLSNATENAINEADRVAGLVQQQVAKNIAALKTQIASEEKKTKNGKLSKTARKNADKRRQALNETLSTEYQNRRAVDDVGMKDLPARRESLRRRRAGYEDGMSEWGKDAQTKTRTDAESSYNDSVAAETAANEARESGSGGSGGSGGFGDDKPLTAGEIAISNADRVAALTDAGLPGGASSMADAIRGQIDANTIRLGEAMAMLSDADPSNDMEANSIISSVAPTIKSLKEQLAEVTGTSPGALTASANALYDVSSQLKDLFKNFGSNVVSANQVTPGVLMGSASSTFTPGPSPVAYGYSPGQNQGRSSAAAGNVVNNYNVDVAMREVAGDPHTFVQQLKWELQTAIV